MFQFEMRTILSLFPSEIDLLTFESSSINKSPPVVKSAIMTSQ